MFFIHSMFFLIFDKIRKYRLTDTTRSTNSFNITWYQCSINMLKWVKLRTSLFLLLIFQLALAMFFFYLLQIKKFILQSNIVFIKASLFIFYLYFFFSMLIGVHNLLHDFHLLWHFTWKYIDYSLKNIKRILIIQRSNFLLDIMLSPRSWLAV